tara:strand:- start:436 stop:753 length:318 start_codon:yes stop_codon:yes gene_type:complete
MAKHGGYRPNSGRKKGSVDHSTKLARDAIAEFVDGNADRLLEWLNQIAEDNPKDAFNAFMSVVEYHIPKLARTEAVVDAKVDVTASISEKDKELLRKAGLSEYLK